MSLESGSMVDRLKRFFGPEVYVNKGKNHRDLSPKQYWKELEELSAIYPDKKSLYVEYRHIEAYDRELADYLINKPFEWLEDATTAISEMVFSFKELPDITVRVTGLPSIYEVGISELRGIHMETFLAIRCIVSKASEVRPAYEKVAFRCMRCGYITVVNQDKDSDVLQEPFTGCESGTCGKKGPYIRVKEESVTYDHQHLRIQEPLESLRGRQPEFLNVSCSEDIAGIVNAGDKVIITGVLKGKPKIIKDGKSKYMDFLFIANAIEKSDSDYENIEISAEEIELFKDMARKGELKTKILESIAPSIFGLKDVKLGIALQLLGGVAVELPDGTRIRGDIHMLLVGDPGVAKSKLLDFVAKFAPRAISFSGKSTSEAGLTGGAVKDELDGKWWIQPGALTLADGGICCADEIDKMKTGQLGSIHEALEQQMVHISKVVKADLWTRTAFLGAANPKYGRYDKNSPIADQIKHGDAFISRMDLLFVLQDVPNQTYDRKLAKHILGTLRGEEKIVNPPMDLELFRKCIAYARTNIKPILDEEAAELIIQFFVDTRTAAGGRTDTVPITARNLEAAFRLATAHAKMRLSEKITTEDVEEAVSLLMRNLRDVGIDPESGELDSNVINVGFSKSQIEKIQKITQIIRELARKDLVRKSAKLEDIRDECLYNKISEYEGLLKKMLRNGDIMKTEEGYYKVTKG